MSLLAVDLGLYAGLAFFDDDGALVWFRSQHFGTVTTLKRAIPRVLDECPGLTRVVVEGDKRLGALWARAAEKRGATTSWVAPETWRAALFNPRDMRTGVDAKATATAYARTVIDACGAKKPKTPLVDDVAEAICIGAWALS